LSPNRDRYLFTHVDGSLAVLVRDGERLVGLSDASQVSRPHSGEGRRELRDGPPKIVEALEVMGLEIAGPPGRGPQNATGSWRAELHPDLNPANEERIESF